MITRNNSRIKIKMGESYLKRKLFCKVKRIQGSQSSMEPRAFYTSSNEPQTNNTIANNNDNDRNIVSRSLNVTTRTQTVNHSSSMPQLPQQQQSQQQQQKQMLTAIEMIRSEPIDCETEGQQQQENNIDEITPDQCLPSDQNNSNQSNNNNLNNVSQEEDIEEAPVNRSNNYVRTSLHKRSASSSRLKSASKAILFFRRAASALKNSTSTNSCSTSSPTLFEHHLNGLPFQRQNTNDSSTQSQNSSSHYSFGFNGSKQSILQTLDKQQQQQQQQVPCKFVVPKLNALKMPLVCLIKSLDGELMREVFVHRYELGQHLIESLKVSLGLEDCKFFGLRLAKGLDDQEDLRNPWLDLNESVCKQIKQFSTKGGILAGVNSNISNNNGSNSSSNCSLRSIDFYLRIKFYPPNLARVQDSFLRNYLWLQLRRDLCLGKLISSMNNLTLLMGCILQYEFGDFKQEYIEKIQALNILPNQDLIEEQAIELWRYKLVGCRKHQAQMKFLRAAVILETYGFDYYPVRDHQRQRAYLLGFNYAGIKTIRNGRIVHHLRWHSLSKICYERRMIIFHQYPTENSKRKQILGFKCLSNEDCQNLYMRLLEQKYFFTVDLAYFDKSVRRPSCLYSSSANNNSLQAASLADNSTAWPQDSAVSSHRSADHHQSVGIDHRVTTPASPQPSNPQQGSEFNKNPYQSSPFNDNEAREDCDPFYVERSAPDSNSFSEQLDLNNDNHQTDDDFMDERWLRRYRDRQTFGAGDEQEQEQHQLRSMQRSETQHSSLDNSTNFINEQIFVNTIPKSYNRSCGWTKKVFQSCQESGLSGLVESVLMQQPSSIETNRQNSRKTNNLSMVNCDRGYEADADDDHRQQQQQQLQQQPQKKAIEDAGVISQLFKFCLLIFIMNILFHLCDNLSTILIDILSYSTTTRGSAIASSLKESNSP